MTSRLLLLGLFALAALCFHVGCEPGERPGLTAEIDDPGYRRGKELIRQGRNQEALSTFLKVIEKRGDDAPESHLEVGLLYQQHIKDPIAAIYHFRKFRELKPNSPQAELVRQRIDAATREFARTLPGQPLDNAITSRFDNYDQLERLQRENEALRAELAATRNQLLTTGPGLSATTTTTRRLADPLPVVPPAEDLAPAQIIEEADSPISRAPVDAGNGEPANAPLYASNRPVAATPAPAQSFPQTPAPRVATPVPPTRPGTGNAPASPSGRRHIVAKGDTLFNLAQRYYGDRSRWRDIYGANRDVMRAENDLRIGIELRIP